LSHLHSKRHPVLDWRLLLSVALLAPLLVACGGGGEKGVRLDPAKADALAAVALPSEKDLPGSGWSVTSYNEFDEEDQPASSEKCKALQTKLKAFRSSLEKNRSGRAQKELEREQRGSFIPVSVEVTIEVYKSTDGLDKALKDFRALVESPDYVTCLEEALETSFEGAQVTVEGKSVSALASVPSGGISAAAELAFSLTNPRLQGTVRFEGYRWRFGNTVAAVALTGPKEGFTADLVNAAVNATVAGLNRASGPNPPTAAAVATSSQAAQATPASTPRSSTSQGRLSDLNSYRYTLRMEGSGGPLAELATLFGATAGSTPTANQKVTFEVKGAYVKPDKGQMTITIGSFIVSQTIIGRQEWTSFGGITQGPSPTNPDPSDLSFVVSLWDEGLSDAVASFSCSSSRETVNSVATRKCGMDQSSFDVLRDLLGGFLGGAESDIKELTRFSLEAWIAESGGYPVRLRIDMAGKDSANQSFSLTVSVDITDVNSTGIKIEAPR